MREVDSLTDRDIFETLYMAYAADDAKERQKAMNQQQEAFEAAYNQKPLDERKRDYYAMCRGLKVPEVQIDAAWDKYLRTGSTE